MKKPEPLSFLNRKTRLAQILGFVWDLPAFVWRCNVVSGMHSVHAYIDLINGDAA